jgi:hypothetical protein
VAQTTIVVMVMASLAKFKQNLEQVALPSRLQSFTFVWEFYQSMEKVALPSHLQSVTSGTEFDQSLEKAALPSRLQSWTSGWELGQNMDGEGCSTQRVAEPSSLRSSTFG